jgi:hypothetical protein
MIRSYNHKGFVLEVSVETMFKLVSAQASEATRYLAVVTISRSGRPVTAFSPLLVAQNRIASFASAEDALMSAHSAAQVYVDDWVATTLH